MISDGTDEEEESTLEEPRRLREGGTDGRVRCGWPPLGQDIEDDVLLRLPIGDQFQRGRRPATAPKDAVRRETSIGASPCLRTGPLPR